MKHKKIILTDKEIVKFNLSPREIVGDCVLWSMGKNKTGYGLFHLSNDRYYLAHRVSYFLHFNGIDDDLVIDHICRNKGCINPMHLRNVPQSINCIENSIGMGAINKKKDRCIRGHYFDEENTEYVKNGRACLKCRKLYYTTKGSE